MTPTISIDALARAERAGSQSEFEGSIDERLYVPVRQRQVHYLTESDTILDPETLLIRDEEEMLKERDEYADDHRNYIAWFRRFDALSQQ